MKIKFGWLCILFLAFSFSFARKEDKPLLTVGGESIMTSEFLRVYNKNLEASLSKNPILVTAMNQIIGYEKAAIIAKKAYKENRPIIDVAYEETDLTKTKLKKLLDPSKLSKGGI